MNTPKYHRKDAFRSGPQSFEFCLCEKHKDEVDDCFDRIVGAPLVPIEPEFADDFECHFCAGEEGP